MVGDVSSDSPNTSAARVCEAHGLAVAEDGKCVLCRRAERPSLLVAPRQETTGDRVVTIVLLACMVAAVAALVWLVRQPRPAHIRRIQDAPAAPAPAPAPAAPVAARDGGVTDGGVAAAGAAGAGSPTERAVAKVSAVRAERIREARAKVVVRMYATQWCSICDAARFYLEAADVDFAVLRSDLDPAIAKQLAKLNPESTVPTFTVDDDLLIGYNPYDLDAKITEHAKRAAGLADPPATPTAPAPAKP